MTDWTTKLESLERRYNELSRQMADPAVLADRQGLQVLAREHRRLEEVVGLFGEYRRAREELAGSRELLESGDADAEFKEMVHAEIAALEAKATDAERRLHLLLLPKDPYDEKNIIIEIRAGTGGDEAALFAAVLFRMYSRYAERRGWKTELLTASLTGIGGYKEVIFAIAGEGVYSRLKFEGGGHRVQRIPETESSGRIHTSMATVAVLAEAEEVDIKISPDELRVDTYCASGPGGQGVNTTYSAVRVTHLPTGLVVTCQDERSQIKNRDRALRVLRARLLERAEAESKAEMAQSRRLQVGSGDRSERVRTYNYPQSRVTDHRIGLSVHRFAAVLDGDLDEFIEALAREEQAELLKGATEQ
jgi:peptide chain release factor 1